MMSLIGLAVLLLITVGVVMLIQPQFRQTNIAQFMIGFMEVIGVNLLLLIFVPLLGSLSPYLMYLVLFGIGGLGIFQLIYVIPRSLTLMRQGQVERLKGVIAAAVIVALINGSCWLMIMGLGH